MLTLGIIEYLFYRLANSGMDLYLQVVCLTDPAGWEMENTFLPMDDKIDPTLLVTSIWYNCYYFLSH